MKNSHVTGGREKVCPASVMESVFPTKVSKSAPPSLLECSMFSVGSSPVLREKTRVKDKKKRRCLSDRRSTGSSSIFFPQRPTVVVVVVCPPPSANPHR